MRGRVSLTGQFASVDEELTGEENLILMAGSRLLAQVGEGAGDELLDAFGLAEATDRQVKTYSGGMRRRLDIATSIVVTPDLVFLDEPTTGLDPRSRNQVWDIIRDLAAGGHDGVPDHAVSGGGRPTRRPDSRDRRRRVIAEGTPGELKASVGSGALRVRLRDPEQRRETEQILSRTLGVPAESGSDPAALSARVSDPERVATALSELSRSGIAVTNFALGQPSLDEVFLALTGHPAEHEESDDKEEEVA